MPRTRSAQRPGGRPAARRQSPPMHWNTSSP